MAKALRAAKAKAPQMEAAPSNETSGPAAAKQGPDASSSGAATGTNSPITPESEGRGGAGDGAGSAESEFRAMFPHLSAEIDAWKAEHGDEPPRGIRIRSKVDGFRRGGMAHSKAPVEHTSSAINPEQLEAILAEPNLTVELF